MKVKIINNPIEREWMKKKRMSKGLTLREIAENFGISFQHYHDIEKGRRNPSPELSSMMANFFNVPLTQLLLEDRTKFKRSELDEDRGRKSDSEISE